MTIEVDAVVIGAEACWSMCAGIAGQRGLRVLLIDHAPKVAEKIRISRRPLQLHEPDNDACQLPSENPVFCRSALAGYTPDDFIALLRRHRIGWHEKHKGQLFCDEGSSRVIEMLLRECDAGGVVRWQPCDVQDIRPCTRRDGARNGARPGACGGRRRRDRRLVDTATWRERLRLRACAPF